MLLFTPLLYNVENTDIKSAAVICERYISIIGIILLTPMFSPERRENIKELVDTKTLSQQVIYFIRIIVSSLILFIIVAFVVAILKFFNGDFNTGKFIMGTFATAFFLGALGFLVDSILGITLAGYMVPFTYLLFEVGNNAKHVGNKFHILSLARDSMIEKYYIFSASVLIIILALTINYIKKRLK